MKGKKLDKKLKGPKESRKKGTKMEVGGKDRDEKKWKLIDN